MSDLLDTVTVANGLNHTRCSFKVNINNTQKSILRSKENLFKPRCNKELKKRLRKYKLRHDGNEDEDVLDVSRILVTSLKIKSPNKLDKAYSNINKAHSEYQIPKNYLFKMVRRRKISTLIETSTTSESQNVDDLCMVPLDGESQNSTQMDAFKLMMDSRNKSIGTNSPGKGKDSEITMLQDMAEIKAIKAKRILSLQKMAENKGSLKKKEIEEYRENCIQKKMLKRAELLKDMITKHDAKVNKREKSSQSNMLNKILETNSNDLTTFPLKNLKSNKTLKLCDMFSDTNTFIDEPNPIGRVSDEDVDFLKKLSPSIRKKENMLCYFKKVPKDLELTPEQNDLFSDESSKSVIKVKFNPRIKMKKKKCESTTEELGSTSSKNSVQLVDFARVHSDNLDKIEQIVVKERRKRKRKKQPQEKATFIINETLENVESCKTKSRPKRTTKKPIKYTENVNCSSSDEELHIFTPKKKRNGESISKFKSTTFQDSDSKIIKKDVVSKETYNKNSVKLSKQSKISNNFFEKQNIDVDSVLKKKLKNAKHANGKSKRYSSNILKNDNKSVKLAPIFVSKPQISQEAIEAKQKFLKSGVPEKLKKCTIQVTNNITVLDNFHSVTHVHQNDSYCSITQGIDWFKIKDKEFDEINILPHYSLKSFFLLMSEERLNIPFVQLKPENVLKCIKSIYPKFPVYRTYHKLRNKCKGELEDLTYTDLDNSIEVISSCAEVTNDYPERLNWCDKYKPMSSNQIIGNFESVKELKKWLETWSEKLIKDKNNGSDVSDMSDFYYSDMDSRDAMKHTNNILILTGPTGCGKTCSVYAVAAELAMKVIEVNASSKRNGKIMLQDLQEATQSHKVNRAKSSIESSHRSSQEMTTSINSKRRGRPKKKLDDEKNKKLTPRLEVQSTASSSQECVRTGMSLILIDDADIVFDQDDGFCSAISQLVQSSKRPVILVTSSPTCPHLQRFFQNGKTIHMRPLSPRMLGTWLDIMCLADIGKCFMGLGEKLLDVYKGDIRRTINCLQFYMNSNKNTIQTDEIVFSQLKCNIDDENSSMSWADSDNLDDPLSNKIVSVVNIDNQVQLLSHGTSSNLFNIWWNLISHFNNSGDEESMKVQTNCIDKSNDIKKIVKVLDTLSIIDFIDMKSDQKSNITSIPWYCSETPSLLESEDFEGYNEAHYISKEISNFLMMNSITRVGKEFNTKKSVNCGLAPSTYIHRERDRIVSRHHTLSSYLNPSAVLDRRATALDYWSSCRAICRIEKSKTDINVKRNNRFCHYLKSLNILCKNDFFDNLAESLN